VAFIPSVIGIRMALGAQSSDVVKGMMAHGIKLIVTGVVLGVGGALAVARVITSVLFDTPATDLAAMIGATTILLFVALLACWIPARMAAQVDPLVALRH
jgi:ABC-type antimicrobial peptide transport system permease subunit